MDDKVTRTRGSILVAVLLLASILLTMGLALLTTQVRSRGGANLVLASAQARLLAQSGLHDAMTKLSKDVTFPPVDVGPVFSYGETLTDPVTHRTAGSYTVTVDTTLRNRAPGSDAADTTSYQYPRCIVRIMSRGTVADAAGRPLATHALYAEVDVSPKARGAAVSASAPDNEPADGPEYYTNPYYNRIIRLEESGCI